MTHPSSAIAIGNFDGVHLGHQRVLRDTVTLALGAGLSPTVLTFDPHPAGVLGRQTPPILTQLRRKVQLVAELGIEHFQVNPFTLDFAKLSPFEFASEVLVKGLGARQVVVGDNFRFGRGRAGNLEDLRGLGQQLGFEVCVHNTELEGGEPISSTRVRAAIIRGDVAHASTLLGRPHMCTGVVVHGFARGRTLGFPTANLGDVRELSPAHGVYAVKVYRADANGIQLGFLAGGVLNVGVRPTLQEASGALSMEAHLFDFEGDLYGAHLGFELVSFLRSEQKFANLEALRMQIAHDSAQARQLIAHDAV